MDTSVDASTPESAEQVKNSDDAQETKNDMTAASFEIDDVVFKKVAARVEAKSLPFLHSDDYKGDDAQQDVARDYEKHYEVFQLETDFIEIQSFLDAEKSKFFASNPMTDEIPFKLREVKFMYDHYYTLTTRFYLKKSLTQRDFMHRMQDGIFLPVIPMASIKDAAKAASGAAVMMQVRQRHISKVDDALWEAFERFWSFFDPKPDQLTKFEEFVGATYIETIEKVINDASEQDPFTFEPAYEVSLGAEESKEEIRTREDLIRQAQLEDGDNVDIRLKKKFAATMLTLSASVEIDEIPLTGLTKFRKQHYFDELGAVIKERLRQTVPEPRIAVDHNEINAKVIEKRKSILTTLTAENLQDVEAAVKAKYDENMKTISPGLRTMLPQEPTPMFWQNNYWHVLFELFAPARELENSLEATQSTRTDVGSAYKVRRLDVGSSAAQNPGDAHVVGARSPKGQSSNSHSHGIEDSSTFGMDALLNGAIYDGDEAQKNPAEKEWIGSVALIESDVVGTHFKMEAWVIECDDAVRSVPTFSAAAKKRTADNDETEVKGSYVLDILMADKQGPILASMWDEEAKAFLRVVTAAKAASNTKPLILLENFRVVVAKNSKTKQLTPLKAVHSMRSIGIQTGTIITLSSSPSSPFTTTAMFRAPISQQYCISDFARARSLLQAPPFRGTFRGIATNTSNIDATMQGKAKLSFDLVDQAGTFIPMKAIGRNANVGQIKDGFDIVIFNASGRPGNGTSMEGAVFLFKDSMVVPIGRCAIPTKVRSIDIE